MSGAPPGPAAWVLREVRPDDSAGLDTISDLHMELLGFGPMAGGWGPPVFSNLSIKRH